MAQFTIYKSTDVGAPVINGISGSLITVLSASLITGYGSQPSAKWTGSYISSSSGLPVKMVFQMGGGNKFYLRVDDTGTTTGLAGSNEAYIRGYETMTNVDTGSGLFPTVVQQGNGGLYVRKSGAASAITRDWILVADDRTFYLFVKSEIAAGTAGAYYGCGYGDFYSFLNNDGYRVMIIGRSATNNAANTEGMDVSVNSGIQTSILGNYIARGHYGLGTSINSWRGGDAQKSIAVNGWFGGIPFTNPADGGLYLSNIWISDPTTTPIGGIRGRLRGFWQWLHPIAMVNDGDTFNGTGDLAGKSFLIVKQSVNVGLYTIETSNTLETN